MKLGWIPDGDTDNPPVPPTDVQVVLRNGQRIPVECVYVGIENGVHMWVAVYAMPDLVVNAKIGYLPPRTGIRISQFDPRDRN